jgi:hypothetical protein
MRFVTAFDKSKIVRLDSCPGQTRTSVSLALAGSQFQVALTYLILVRFLFYNMKGNVLM